MIQTAANTVADPERRRWFQRLAQAGDALAPHRAPWRRMAQVTGQEGDVFWAGWANDHEVFVVGDEGRILHFDANRATLGSVSEAVPVWQPMQAPVRLPLHDIWGHHRNALFAVGWMGVVLHYDGVKWRQIRGAVVNKQTQRYDSTPENTPLFALTGDQNGRIWAVGDNGMVLARINHVWQVQPTPVSSNLRDIVRTEGGQLFAVGSEGTLITSQGDGHWESIDCPVAAGFTSIVAVSDNELLLGGGRYFVEAGGFRGELLRWQNGRFTVIEVADKLPRIRALRCYKEGVLVAADQGCLYYLQGTRLDQLHTDTKHDLMDIVPLSGGEALALGDFSTIMTAAPDFITALAPAQKQHDTAADWRVLESGTHHSLRDVTHGADGLVYACGDHGTVLCGNDKGWSPLPAFTEAAVHCLCYVDGAGLFAGNAMGQIHCYDGKRWHLSFDLCLDITLLGLWAAGPSSIFAVGDEGLILHFDGQHWKRMVSGTKSALYRVWGYDADHVLAVGDFGLILRWNGENWAEFYAGTESFLFDVWGDALDNIYVVGLSGTLSRFDGQRWLSLPTRTRDDLLAIHGRAGQHPWAVGTLGAVLRFDGTSWQTEAVPTDTSLRGISVAPHGDVVAVGDHGIILKRQ